MDREATLSLLTSCSTKAEAYEKLGYSRSVNKRTRLKILSDLRELGIDLEQVFVKAKCVDKVCPVCGENFSTRANRENITCSRSCSNTLFRSGENHPNWKDDGSRKYRYICFKSHTKACVICGESLIVEVHHYDEDHSNNNPDNLVPMCPTHHAYIHSRHAYLIRDKVDAYVKAFSSATRNDE